MDGCMNLHFSDLTSIHFVKVALVPLQDFLNVPHLFTHEKYIIQIVYCAWYTLPANSVHDLLEQSWGKCIIFCGCLW